MAKEFLEYTMSIEQPHVLSGLLQPPADILMLVVLLQDPAALFDENVVYALRRNGKIWK